MSIFVRCKNMCRMCTGDNVNEEDKKSEVLSKDEQTLPGNRREVMINNSIYTIEEELDQDKEGNIMQKINNFAIVTSTKPSKRNSTSASGPSYNYIKKIHLSKIVNSQKIPVKTQEPKFFKIK